MIAIHYFYQGINEIFYIENNEKIRSIIYILKQSISERFFFVILNGEQSYLLRPSL